MNHKGTKYTKFHQGKLSVYWLVKKSKHIILGVSLVPLVSWW